MSPWPRIRARLRRNFPVEFATQKEQCEEALTFMESYLAEHPDASERDVLRAGKAALTFLTLEILILLAGLALDLYRVWRDS